MSLPSNNIDYQHQSIPSQSQQRFDNSQPMTYTDLMSHSFLASECINASHELSISNSNLTASSDNLIQSKIISDTTLLSLAEACLANLQSLSTNVRRNDIIFDSSLSLNTTSNMKSLKPKIRTALNLVPKIHPINDTDDTYHLDMNLTLEHNHVIPSNTVDAIFLNVKATAIQACHNIKYLDTELIRSNYRIELLSLPRNCELAIICPNATPVIEIYCGKNESIRMALTSQYNQLISKFKSDLNQSFLDILYSNVKMIKSKQTKLESNLYLTVNTLVDPYYKLITPEAKVQIKPLIAKIVEDYFINTRRAYAEKYKIKIYGGLSDVKQPTIVTKSNQNGYYNEVELLPPPELKSFTAVEYVQDDSDTGAELNMRSVDNHIQKSDTITLQDTNTVVLDRLVKDRVMEDTLIQNTVIQRTANSTTNDRVDDCFHNQSSESELSQSHDCDSDNNTGDGNINLNNRSSIKLADGEVISSSAVALDELFNPFSKPNINNSGGENSSKNFFFDEPISIINNISTIIPLQNVSIKRSSSSNQDNYDSDTTDNKRRKKSCCSYTQDNKLDTNAAL